MTERALAREAMGYPRLRARLDPEIGPAWLDRRERRLARLAVDTTRTLERDGVDRLVVWNGWEASARLAVGCAERLGIACLRLENGIWPDRLQADFRGINGASSSARLDPRRLPAASGALDRAWRAARDGRRRDDAAPVPDRPLPRSRELLSRVVERPLHPARLGRALARLRATPVARPTQDHVGTPPPCGPFVLLALQVPDDTQLLLFADVALRDPAALVAPARAAVDAALGSEVALVVKPHPLDPWSGRIARAVAGVRGAQLAAGPVAPWLRAATAVVVVNSTVGFEAVLHGRAVVTLAPALYGHGGVVRRARGLRDLAPALRGAVERPRDGDLTRRFAAHLAFGAGVPGHRGAVFPETVDALAALLDAGRHPWWEPADG